MIYFRDGHKLVSIDGEIIIIIIIFPLADTIYIVGAGC